MVAWFWSYYSYFKYDAGISFNPDHKFKWEFCIDGKSGESTNWAIGTYRLFLDTNKHIDLFQTFYVPSLSRNLVSLPELDIDGYFINLGIKVLLYLKIPLLLVLVFFLMVCTNLTFMMNFLKSFSPCIIVLVLNVA